VPTPHRGCAVTGPLPSYGGWQHRGDPALQDTPLYPLEQEYSLEQPLGYLPVPSEAAPRVAVLLHAFHLDLLPEFRAYIEHIPFSADLFVSTDSDAKRPAVATQFADWRRGAFEIRVVPNRGRDVAPKLVGFADIHERYEYVLHLHTKRSPHDSRLAGWRGYLLETLLGTPSVVEGIFEAFAQSPRLGIMAPQHVDELRPWIHWGANFDNAEALAVRMGIAVSRLAPFDFPSGSMFWARSAALRPLLNLHLRFEEFPEEQGQTDGTLAHAIERLYFLVCEQAGFDWIKISARGALHDQRGVTAVGTPAALRRFLSRRRIRLGEMRGETRVIEEDPIITTLPSRPRRPLHVLWRRALGEDVLIPAGRQLAILLPPGLPEGHRLAANVQAALRQMPAETAGLVLTAEAPGLGENDATWRNRALRAGFAAGGDLVLLLSMPGLLHPGSAAALLRMSEAHSGRAILEVARFPQSLPKPVDPKSFATPWGGGPALAIPRAVFDATGGFDEALGTDVAEVDFSRRARALGFAVLWCPRALFLAAPETPQDTAAGLSSASNQRAAEAKALVTAQLCLVGQSESGARLMEPNGLDIVIRLFDLADLPRLDRCLFALFGQSVCQAVQCDQGFGLLRVHLMLRRFAFTEVQEVRAALQPLRVLDSRATLTVHNWDNPEPFLLDVPLLNWGLDVARGRYFTCVEVDDVLVPGACARLLSRLRTTPAALALGGMQRRQVRWWGDVVLPLPESPPVSDHGGTGDAAMPFFLVDRMRLPLQELVFQIGTRGMEVTEFVQRIGARHMTDTTCADQQLGLHEVAA